MHYDINVIIVQSEEISYSDHLKLHYQQTILCPNCSEHIAMQKYGYRLRKVKDFQANTYWIELPKYRCPKCRKIYLTLPTFLIPYKHYDRSTIERIQNGIRDGCGASYLTIYLWSRYLQTL